MRLEPTFSNLELWEAATRSFNHELQEAILRWAEVVEAAYRE